MKGNGRVAAIGVALYILCLSLAGCGKKGDPIPQQWTPLPVVASLSLEKGGEGVTLRWLLTDHSESVSVFKLYRSNPSEKGEDCPGCPRDFRLMETVAASDAGIRRQGGNGFLYLDRSAVAGQQYYYKVAGCDRAGHCGELSPEAGIIEKNH